MQFLQLARQFANASLHLAQPLVLLVLATPPRRGGKPLRQLTDIARLLFSASFLKHAVGGHEQFGLLASVRCRLANPPGLVIPSPVNRQF